MKTVILCGGRGMRLNQETEFKPKPLVKIGNEPILLHIMRHYIAYGHNDFVLPLGYKGDSIKDYFLKLDEGSRDFSLDLKTREKKFLNEKESLDAKVTFIGTGLESLTGSRIAQIRDHLKGEEDFFLTYGDAVSDLDIGKLYDQHKKLGTMVTLSQVIPSSQYGEVASKEGIVTTFREKPSVINASINGGFMVCNKELFKYLSTDQNCILEKELPKIADEGKLGAYLHEGFWHSMDTQRDVNDLNKLWENSAPWKI